MKEIIEKLVDGFNKITAMSDYQDCYDLACDMISYGDDYLNHIKQEEELKSEEMEKQPTEYEYVKVSLEQVIEDIMTKKIESYFFIAPDKNEYRVETLSIEQLKLHKDNLYQHVELTPEQLHERKVEELAKTMMNANILSHPVWDDCCQDTIANYKSMAKAALEWMKSKGK